MDLITITEAEAYLSLDTGKGGATLSTIITETSDAMALVTGRGGWGTSESRTEYHHGGRPYLLPKYLPISSVTSINDDPEHTWGTGTALTANEDYHVSDSDNLVWSLYGNFMDGVKSVKLVYVGGYSVSTVPASLKRLCKMQVKHEWDSRFRPGRGQQEDQFTQPGELLPVVKEGLLNFTPRIPFQ